MVTRRTPAEEWIEMSRLLHQLRAQVWAHLSQALCALLRRLPGGGSHTPTPTPERPADVQPATTRQGLGTKGWGLDTYRRLRATDPLLYPTDELSTGRRTGPSDIHLGLTGHHAGPRHTCPACTIVADNNEADQ